MFSTAIVLIVLGCALGASAKYPNATEAQAECCPHWYIGNTPAFNKCCLKYGLCPMCPQNPLQFGCRYRGQWFAVGSVIEANAEKCYEVHCVRKAPSFWPSVHIQHISDECNCCEYDGRVYEHDHIIHLDECERIQCSNGTWEKLPPTPGDTMACPADTTPWGNFCIYFWPVIMSWPDAQRTCHLLGGWLISPLKPVDNELIADGLRGAGGWLRGGNGRWPDTRGRAWKVSPWAPGQPTNGTADKCLGIASGDRAWSALPCDGGDYGLKPVCIVPKVPCDQRGCVVNDKKYNHGDVIHLFDKCHRIICNDGYPKHEIKPDCCYFEGWHGKWGAGYYPPGSFSPFPNIRCFCQKNGQVICLAIPEEEGLIPVKD